MRPQSLSVIGLGAIGGSVAWQARKAGIPRVIGFASDRNDRVQAIKAAAVDDVADSAIQAVKGADLVVLAVPPMAVLQLLGDLAPHIEPGALVTDVASIKLAIVQRAMAAGLARRFAGSHPFAGTHIAGWNGARPDRLTGAVVYVCSTGDEGEPAAREILNFWETVYGAHPVRIDASSHDAQLGWTSHLPQALSTVLARTLSAEDSLRGVSFGTGARDTTRLAASPTAMWTDILLLNAGPVDQALARAGAELDTLRQLIAHGDRAGLERYLDQAAQFRRQWDG